MKKREADMANRSYEDIINLAYPFERASRAKHPPMTRADRAKIFAPFAALKGYEEAIEAKQKILVPKITLSEEAKEELDVSIRQMKELLEQGMQPVVTVVYFEEGEDDEPAKGVYVEFTGKAVKMSESSKTLQIVDRKIQFDNIRGLFFEKK